MQIVSGFIFYLKVVFQKQVVLEASAPSASASPSWSMDWRSPCTHSFSLYVDNHRSVSLKCARSTMQGVRFVIGNRVIGCQMVAGVS